MTTMVIMKSPSERAQRATEQAKRLLPGWATFVRMLARDSNLIVKLTAGTPCTDGKTVWLRVPLELGDEVPHDKSVCGIRDTDKSMMCAACAVLDGVNATVFHEVAHIVYGSFEEVSDADRLRMTKEAIRLECGGKGEGTRAAKITKRIEKYPHPIGTWPVVAHLVSPFLPMLLNAVEDVWVNAEMMDARPGTKSMFSAQTNKIFDNGVERDGGWFKWSEQPLNAQVVIGVYCLGSRLDFSSWLDPKVVEDLGDREIVQLAHRITTTRSAAGRYRLSIKLLEALRRLGYLVSEDDPEADPEPGAGEPSESSEPSGDGESDDESTEGGEGGDDGEAGDSGDGGGSEADDADADADDDEDGMKSTGKTSDDSESSESSDPFRGADKAEYGDESDSGDGGEDGEAGASLSSGGHEGSPMGEPEEVEELFKIFGRHDDDDDDDDAPKTPEEIELEREVERAIVQGDHFDQPSRGLVGLKVNRVDDPTTHNAFNRGYGTLTPIPESILAPSLMKLRIAFAVNRQSHKERNLTSGRRLDSRVIGRRIPVEDPRLFTRRSVAGKRDYFVVIGLDISGSTSGSVVTLIKEAGLAQAELLSRLGVQFALYCHSGDSADVLIFEIKGPNEPWGNKQREALSRIGAYSANLDGHTLEFYRKRAEESRATDKIIMYYTDGAMPCENYSEELAVLKQNIALCGKREITLVGVGVGNDDPVKYGLDTIRLDKLSDIPKVVEGLGKRLA